MLAPWTLSQGAASQYLREWAKLTPSDFLFSFQKEDDDDSSLICLVPAAYFKQFGHMLKSSMPISHLLPLCMVEGMPSVFTVDNEPSANPYWFLHDNGFQHNKNFQSFITYTNPLEIYG